VKKLFKVRNEYFEKKTEAKAYRNKLEKYIPVRDKKTGELPKHIWKYEVKRGPDHHRGESK